MISAKKVKSAGAADGLALPQLYFQFTEQNFDPQKVQIEKQAIASVAKIISNSHPKPFSNITPTGSIMANLKAAAGIRKPSLITRHIMIGGRDDVCELTELKALGVSHVLNLTSVVPNYFPESLVYCHLPLQDAETVNITECVPAACSFIRHVERMRGRVMVHCVAGVSRSVTIVLMHLMAAHNLKLNRAYLFVESIRSFIQPNDGFKLQLALFEVNIYKCSSIAQNKKNRAGYHKAWDFYGWNSIKGDIAAGDLSSCVGTLSTTSGASTGGTRLINVSSSSSSHAHVHNQGGASGRSNAGGNNSNNNKQQLQQQQLEIDYSDCTPPPTYGSNNNSIYHHNNNNSNNRGRRKSSSRIKAEPAICDGGNPGKLNTPQISPRSNGVPTWVNATISPRLTASSVSMSVSGAGLSLTLAEEAQDRSGSTSALIRGKERNDSMSIGNIEAIDSPLNRFAGRLTQSSVSLSGGVQQAHVQSSSSSSSSQKSQSKYLNSTTTSTLTPAAAAGGGGDGGGSGLGSKPLPLPSVSRRPSPPHPNAANNDCCVCS